MMVLSIKVDGQKISVIGGLFEVQKLRSSRNIFCGHLQSYQRAQMVLYCQDMKMPQFYREDTDGQSLGTDSP